MELNISGSEVKITGNIKSISDFQTIKTQLDELSATHSSIKHNIVDSISITSSVIGYFVKLIHKDGIKLSMDVGEKRLLTLISELGLSQEFNVRERS